MKKYCLKCKKNIQKVKKKEISKTNETRSIFL